MCSIYLKPQPPVYHGIDHPFHQLPLSQVVVFCSIKRMPELGRFFDTNSWTGLVYGILHGWIFFLIGFVFLLSFLDSALEAEAGGHRSRGQSHEEDASAPQGGGNNAAPYACSSNSLQSSGSGAPRSHYSRHEAPGDGESDDDEDAKKPQPGRNSTPSHHQQRPQTEAQKRVHCPCFLRDQVKYRDCWNFRAKDWKDLREHMVTRKHQCIHYCAVCWKEFKSQDAWEKHTQKRTCPLQPQPEQSTTLHITRSQEDKIRKLTRKGMKAKPLAENWRSIWRILFGPIPPPVSPYVSTGPLVLGPTTFSKRVSVLSENEDFQQELINLPAMANVSEGERIGIAEAVIQSLVSKMEKEEARGKGVQMIAEPSNTLSPAPHVSPTVSGPVTPQNRGQRQQNPTPSATTLQYATPGTSITKASNVEDEALNICVPGTSEIAPASDPGRGSSSGLDATFPPGETPPCPVHLAGNALPAENILQPGPNENFQDWHFGMAEDVGLDLDLGMNFGAYGFSGDLDPSFLDFTVTDERVEGPPA